VGKPARDVFGVGSARLTATLDAGYAFSF